MTLDPKVQELLKEIRTAREKGWKGALGEDLRPWMNFAGIKKVGKFDLDGLFELFDRKKLDDDYLKARSSGSTVTKDVWVPKIASDLIAGFQRDHVTRMRSRIRTLAHSAARMKSDGQTNGPLTVNTLTLFARIETSEKG